MTGVSQAAVRAATGAVDRSDPLPLWAQVLGDLTVRLDAGEFDEHFPTDQELVQAYDVSRQTVRDAVRRLSDAGRVDARARTRHASAKARV